MSSFNAFALKGTLQGEESEGRGDTEVVGFSDASGWNEPDCASICLISGSPRNFEYVLSSLNHAIDGDSELKWKSVDGHKSADKASNALACILEMAADDHLRVDVIIWNEDGHYMRYPGHNDYWVLKRMYSMLLSNVLADRWQSAVRWKHFADQQDGVDWVGIDDETGWRLRDAGREQLLEQMKLTEQVDSTAYRMVQAADLFAGLARFSYVVHNRLNPPLLGVRDPEGTRWSKPSRVDEFRLRVLEKFITDCRNHSFNVRNEPPKRGLFTQNPNEPVNFWPYESKHPNDRGKLLQKPNRVYGISNRWKLG